MSRDICGAAVSLDSAGLVSMLIVSAIISDSVNGELLSHHSIFKYCRMH
jgi:hypothetical protein